MSKDWLFSSDEYICDLRTVAVLLLKHSERNGIVFN